jgi:ABC-type multidrug transport system fused ATPase/permease subunit
VVHREADIWVLDEPASALDPAAEAAIFADLRERLRGRMGIDVSHRFSAARLADRIAVLSAGRVAEIGTHEELVANGGAYPRLFDLRARAYR